MNPLESHKIKNLLTFLFIENHYHV